MSAASPWLETLVETGEATTTDELPAVVTAHEGQYYYVPDRSWRPNPNPLHGLSQAGYVFGVGFALVGTWYRLREGAGGPWARDGSLGGSIPCWSAAVPLVPRYRHSKPFGSDGGVSGLVGRSPLGSGSL